jgi:alpha,alpha-trehalose phosphorylase
MTQNGNTRDGPHVAALVGSWIALVAGPAGVRDRDRTLSIAPPAPRRADQPRLRPWA